MSPPTPHASGSSSSESFALPAPVLRSSTSFRRPPEIGDPPVLHSVRARVTLLSRSADKRGQPATWGSEMAKGRNQHVVPRDGGWAVKPEGGQRASSIHGTQREAIDRGREVSATNVRNSSSTDG